MPDPGVPAASTAAFSVNGPTRLRVLQEWVHSHPVRAATLGNWFQLGCSMLATAVTLPFIIRHLSPFQVGLWLTFQSCLNLLTLTNFGFSFAISRQTAFVIGARDEKAFEERSDFIPTSIGWAGISELYSGARILFRWVLLVAILLILAIFFFLQGTGRVQMNTLPLWLIMGCGLLFNLNVQRFSPFLDGLGFMAYSRGIAGVYQLVWSTLAVATLIVRPSLFLLAGAVLIASALQWLAFRAALIGVGGRNLDRHSRPPAKLVRRLLGVATPVGVVLSASYCVSQIQIPLLGFFLGVENVTPYYVAQKLGQMLFALFAQVFQSQMPRFTQELGSRHWGQAFHRMKRLLILAGFGSLFVGAVYWAISPVVVRLWLGPGHYVSSTVLVFMALDFALLSFTVPWAWFVLAAGKNPFVATTIVHGVLNLVFIGVFVPRMGLLGLPLAGIVSGFATNHVYNIFKGKKLLNKLSGQSMEDAPSDPATRYALFCDAMPLREGGSGTGVLGWNWLSAMKDRTVLVLAPPPDNAQAAERATAETGLPVKYLPSLPVTRRYWYSRLRGPLEFALFLFNLAKVCDEIRNSGANRVFAFAGARIWFLAKVRLLRWCLPMPIELYLVDDFEAWQRLHSRTLAPGLIRWLERGALRRVDRVWAISPAYATHLENKYNVPARWLPVIVREGGTDHVPYQIQQPDVRSFVFMGALNLLYHDALLAFAQTLAELNRSGQLGYQSRLDIYTYLPFDACRPEWKNQPHIQLHCQKPDEVRRAAVRSAWAIVLAFAFDEKPRLMVSTSFSTKFTESLTSGRPVIFFGPEDSAVVAHARDQHLPFVATSLPALPAALAEIERADGPTLIARYRQTLEQFHSPRALQRYLGQPLPGTDLLTKM